MSTKLTLTLDKSVIERAKRYAKEQKRSLSDIVENYLKVLAGDVTIDHETKAPIIESLKGSFKAPEQFDYKTELHRALAEKHLNT